MAENRKYRVFIASPGDVGTERDAIRGVVDEINQTHGDPLGYKLDLLRWEDDVAPGGGPPQPVVNQDIGEYEIFVGVMWRRFGTPTETAESGTEEEYRIAFDRWQKNPEMPLMFYFCQQEFMPRSLDDVDQMGKVLKFRRELEGKALVWEYESHEAFADHIRKHLCMRINRLVAAEWKAQEGGSLANDETIREFRALWPRMQGGLQKAFCIAYNQNRRKGDAGVGTRDIFSSLLRTSSEELAPFLRGIPRNALPAPTAGQVVDEDYIRAERPWFSPCITKSIHRLGDFLPDGRLLSPADVFADLARHGTGGSVKLLRKYLIRAEDIERIIKTEGLDVLVA